MEAANKEVIKESQKRQLAEIVGLYMNQSPSMADQWAGLLLSISGFSLYYYRTHLMLGERSNYRLTARAKGKHNLPPKRNWYLKSPIDNDRPEDVLDQVIYFVNGEVSARVIGLDKTFNRVLTEDGAVYALGNRVRLPQHQAPATPRLFMAP